MSLVCYWTVDSNTCRSEDRRQRPSHLWSSHCQCSKVQIHSILYSLITTERQVFKELGFFSREDSCISVWTISDSYKFLAASICCFCFIFWSTPFTCKGTSSLRTNFLHATFSAHPARIMQTSRTSVIF